MENQITKSQNFIAVKSDLFVIGLLLIAKVTNINHLFVDGHFLWSNLFYTLILTLIFLGIIKFLPSKNIVIYSLLIIFLIYPLILMFQIIMLVIICSTTGCPGGI